MSIDIIGTTYNHLTVKKLYSNINYRKRFICECKCGNEVIVQMQHLRNGHTKSCGCLNHLGNRRTHGMAGTKLYKVYYCMLDRCHNPKATSYHKYGAKGIKVCNDWRNSFESFLDWATDYKEGLSIDRIDNTKGYYPDNCRWTTPEIQIANSPKKCTNTTGWKYIHWHNKKQRFIVKIKGKQLKCFKTIEPAIEFITNYLTNNNMMEELKGFNYGHA